MSIINIEKYYLIRTSVVAFSIHLVWLLLQNVSGILFIMRFLYTILFHIDFFKHVLFVFTPNFFFHSHMFFFFLRVLFSFTRFVYLFIYTIFLPPFLLLLHDIFTHFTSFYPSQTEEASKYSKNSFITTVM